MRNATRPYVCVRVNQATDQAIWDRYDVDNVGVFLILDHEGKFVTEVPLPDLTTDATTAAFLRVLPEVWEVRRADAKPLSWQTDLEAARAEAAKTGRPIAAVSLHALKPAPAPDPSDPFADPNPMPEYDAPSRDVLRDLDDIRIAAHYERFVWLRVDWFSSKPEMAGPLALRRAPELVLIDADGKRLLERPPLEKLAALAAKLDKVAARAEAARERVGTPDGPDTDDSKKQ